MKAGIRKRNRTINDVCEIVNGGRYLPGGEGRRCEMKVCRAGSAEEERSKSGAARTRESLRAMAMAMMAIASLLLTLIEMGIH
jgi:hypothetical protein